MKRKNCVYYIFSLCMLLICITACEKEDATIEKNIPATIKNDFRERNPSAKIETYRNYSEDLHQIDFMDKEKNTASVWYVNETWKITHTKINNINQLSSKALETFKNTEYRSVEIDDIYKTEREGIEKSLYTLHFKYPRKNAKNIEHYVFINDDGLLLKTITWTPNDPCASIKLPKEHFDYIAQKYKGAKIRGYINDGGAHEYPIVHNDTIKYVKFRGEVATDFGFWKETRYELSINAYVPENVVKALKRIDPDFTYTNLYYIESEEGNEFFFHNKNHESELGYILKENI